MRQVAQQLVAHVACRESPPDTSVLAAARVLNGLRRPLCTLAGVNGMRVLLVRALALARAQDSALSVVRVEADASLAGLDELPGGDAAVLLIAQLLGLLSTFIGESLMMKILLDAWPDLNSRKPHPSQEEDKT